MNKTTFKDNTIRHSEPALAGEESTNSWILRFAQNDEYGILSKINTFLKKSLLN